MEAESRSPGRSDETCPQDATTMEAVTETAFSRLSKSVSATLQVHASTTTTTERRKAYGTTRHATATPVKGDLKEPLDTVLLPEALLLGGDEEPAQTSLFDENHDEDDIENVEEAHVEDSEALIPDGSQPVEPETEQDEPPLELVVPDSSQPTGRTKRTFGAKPPQPTPRETQPDEEDLVLDASQPEEDPDQDAPHSNETETASSQEEPMTQNTEALTQEEAHDGKEEKTDQKRSKKHQPEEEELVTSIDNLYVNADKNSVTVGDIVRSLEEEFDCKLKKSTKKLVRSHLTDLILGKVEPCVAGPSDEAEAEAEEMSEDDDDLDNDDDLFDNDISSDYDEEPDMEDTKKKKTKENSKQTSKKMRKKKASRPTTRSKTTPPKGRRKPSHLKIHAETLRKKQIDEMRVRKEELAGADEDRHVSQEDRTRAEQIAAKFETDSEDRRIQRLEDRRGLLAKLDQKRMDVIGGDEEEEVDMDMKLNTLAKEEKEAKLPTSKEEAPRLSGSHNAETHVELDADESGSDVDPEEDEESDESDDDLEIVGFRNAPALKVLTSTMDDPKDKVFGNASPMSVMDLLDGSKSFEKKPAKRSMQGSENPRTALRNALKLKQMKAGNAWLARELGYKNEEEHIMDCKHVEKKKRQQTFKREEGRRRLREQQLLREEKMEIQDESIDTDLDDPNNVTESEDPSATIPDEEEDEELAMARELEEEQGKDSTHDAADDNDDNMGTTEEDSKIVTDDDDHCESVQTDGEGKDESISNSACPSDEATEVISGSDKDNENTDRLDSIDEERNPGMPTDENMDEDAISQNSNAPDTEEQVITQDDSSVPSAPSSDSVVDSAKSLEKEDVKEDDGDQVGNTEKEDEEEEYLFEDEEAGSMNKKVDSPVKEKKDRNAGWKAMLQKEAEMLKKQKGKRNNGKGLVEAEADEEEDEEGVAGLEDFGFAVKKKNKDDDDEEADDVANEDDLANVVDDVSDDEGDEDAGEEGRKIQDAKEEKDRHKEIMRRMREGYDGRRGGIAGGGTQRGVHRFDELVAADNRDDAKRLGLLNDDELDSDDEEKEFGEGENKPDEEEDETALLDKMLKDRFLKRDEGLPEEQFSDDDDNDNEEDHENGAKKEEDEEDKEQERLAKRFAKRARMQRLLEMHSGDGEFSQSRLIDEDQTMKQDLMKIKSVIHGKKRQISSSSLNMSSSSSLGVLSNGDSQEEGSQKKQKIEATGGFFGSDSNAFGTGCLPIALRASRGNSKKRKTSFLGGKNSSNSAKNLTNKNTTSALSHHVLFQMGESRQSHSLSCGVSASSRKSTSNMSGASSHPTKRVASSTSLW
eukprot:CAMPEP_0198305260 /NCGR_PEP_ID=MMETSP1449-20131203/57818_1 /TAXON_ID=420275 /ORGANISM="Attheya septentrionalis, Strain CCMP2084" /LENGTH=1320 /DNA_ID=CAMNT_0044007793 /DNA_START=191 /DNA_END=4150 /DNA_ORIENTATION=-